MKTVPTFSFSFIRALAWQSAIFITLFILFACPTLLSAQITREQADQIVWEHLQKEVSQPYFLYANTHTPSVAGINITTSNAEVVKIKYASWAYYLNEFPVASGPSQHRYLFVKEDNGNLLEIITTNDIVPDLTEWELLLGIVDLKSEAISIYPNPTTGELTIDNGQLTINNVEVFDIYGRKIHSSTLTSYLSPLTSINISHLPSGIYFVKISTEAGEVVRKVIKN